MDFISICKLVAKVVTGIAVGGGILTSVQMCKTVKEIAEAQKAVNLKLK